MKPVYLAKLTKVVITSSPNEKHSYKLLKKGLRVFLPPWELDEVKKLFDIHVETGIKYGHKVMNFSIEVNKVSNEVNDTIDKEDMWEEIKKRYDVVGGKLGLLFHPQFSVDILKSDVYKAVEKVSIDSLSNEGSFDIHSDIPSILYSIYPNSRLNGPPTLRFASPFVQQLCISK
ncbi:hypothetical protein O9G_006380, partial [Rozella allomycis CSF55]